MIASPFLLAFQAKNLTINVTIGNYTEPLPSVHGWIIWQQRINASSNFDLPWADYKSGFGTISLTGDYWLGLDAVHALTTGAPGGAGAWKLRVEMQAKENNLWFVMNCFVLFDEFRIE